MTTLEQREAAFERRFAGEEDAKFRLRVRRDRIVAQWAAQGLGFEGPGRDAVAADLARFWVGKDDALVLEDLRSRFEAAAKPIEPSRIARKLAAAELEAAAAMANRP